MSLQKAFFHKSKKRRIINQLKSTRIEKDKLNELKKPFKKSVLLSNIIYF